MTHPPPSDPDYWYDPDGTDAAMLGKIREAGEYRRSDPPATEGLQDPVRAAVRAAVLAERAECLRIMQGCTNWYDAIDRIRARPTP